MHVDGEVDIRGVYCALSVARLTNIYTDALFDNSAIWIIRWVVAGFKINGFTIQVLYY